MAIAATIETMDGCMIATSTIASAKLGTVWKNSVKRIRASSILPAEISGVAPSGMPTASDASVEIRPTSSETRAVDDARHHVAAERVGAERQAGHRERRQERPLHHAPGRGRKQQGTEQRDRDRDVEDRDADHAAGIAQQHCADLSHAANSMRGSTER